MNVEIGVAAMDACATVVAPVIRVIKTASKVAHTTMRVVAPISTLFLRMGRCSLSAIPADNFIVNGGHAVLV